MLTRIAILILICYTAILAKEPKLHQDARIIAHVVDMKKSNLSFYLRDDNGTILRSFENLNKHLASQNKRLIFAMNGGMYMENSMPLGLYIEDSKTVRKINRIKDAFGNFYMQPNGIFYITKSNIPHITTTGAFHTYKDIKYATQSGPMLVIDNKINTKFRPNSKSLHVRNGVGILPNGKILFAISKSLINFYDFADYFKQNGCKNALYLDGAISQIYLPPKYLGYNGSKFGVIIGETNK